MLGLGTGFHTISKSDYPFWYNAFSIDFDGVNDNMTFDSGINEVFTSLATASGTVSVWVKLDSVSANANVIKASVDTANNIEFAYLNSSTNMLAKYKAGNVTRSVQIPFDFEGNDNWYHLAMSWDVEADEFKAYINGAQSGTTQTGLGTWSGNINSVKVAQNSLGDNTYWNGHIDELSFFSGALSATQVSTDLYNGGVPKDLASFPNLVGHWRFDKASGTNVEDVSTNNNDGTLVNGAAITKDIP
tara:strand:- start:567 stop:1301 length:735 start_codon:yes stop_codon:yes gene_type:complete